MVQVMAPEEKRMNREVQECVDNLRMCISACWDTMDYCLKKGGKHEEHSHIKLMIDCAEICQAALSFIDRKSEFVHQVCDACADICQRCADDCETFKEDIHMQECAAVCQKCAGSCRRMEQASGSSI